MTDEDAQGEKRHSSPIGSTRGIPAGTLLTVPAAPPEEKTPNAPVVAVDAIRWYQSWEIWLAGIALPILEMIDEPVLRVFGVKNNGPRHVVIFALGFFVAYRHARHHEAIR